MFGLFKKAAVTTAVAGTLAVAAVAGSPPAPAQALVPLVPIAIAGAAGVGGTTVSVGGMIAGIGAIAGTLGLGLAISQPGSSPIKDWLNEEVSNPWEFFFGKTDEPVPPSGEVKDVPAIVNPNGNETPSQSEYVWTSPYLSASVAPARSTDMRSMSYTIRHNQGGADNNSVNLSVHRNWECVNKVSGALREGGGNVAYNYGSVTKSNYVAAQSRTETISCAADEKIVSIRLAPPTTAQKAAGSPSIPSGSEATYRWAGTTLTWRSQDHPGYANKQILAEATCVTPEGVETKISLGTDLNPDGSMPSNINIPSCKAAGLGDVAKSLNVGWADGTKVKQPIFTATPTDPMLNCDPAFGQVCKMEIYIDGKPCVIGSPACESWAGLARVSPMRVQCVYGGKVVDMSACGIMEGAYVKGGTPAVKENIDGDPDTWKIPATVPGWQPHINPNGDPVPDPDYTPDPNKDPALDPAPNPNPDPEIGGSTPPGPSITDPVPNPQTPPQGQNGNCWANSSAWNPIEWVYQPVLCALNAAFVPKTPIQARLDGMAGQFSNKVPLSWFGVGLEPVAGGSCPTSWQITWRGETHSLICGTAADGIIQTFRPVLGGMLVMAAVWPLMRSLFYSSIPVLKVTPS